MTYTMVGVCKDKDPPIRYRKLVVDAGMMFNFPSNYMKRLSFGVSSTVVLITLL